MRTYPMIDVIIVGGGLTGGTLAIAIAEKGLNVALVDSVDPRLPLTPDGRSFGLSRSSYNVLSKLGLWPEDATAIKQIHISEEMRPQHMEYTDDKTGAPLGYVVDSTQLKTKINEKLISFKNIQLFAPSSVQRLEQRETDVMIETADGNTITAPLCVAADGRSSDLRTWAKIPVVSWDYDQKAIICNIAHSLPHENQAFEHFLPSGPLAFVPRSGQESGLAWSIESVKADVLMGLSEDEFSKEVQAHFGNALGELTLASKRWCYPLNLCLPKKIIDTRLALVGDAAHAFHPVSAQGLNVGLRDVAALAELLSDAYSLGLDPGSSSLLERYQRWRRKDILSMSLLTDGLVRLFSNKSQTLARGRSLGFGLAKNVRPIKKLITRHAMGLTGKVPSLAQD